MYGAHTNAQGSKLDMAIKRSNVSVQLHLYHFSNFGRSLIPDDLCKDSAQGILGSGEKDF